MNRLQSLLRRDDEETKHFFPPENKPWQCTLLSRYLRMGYSFSWSVSFTRTLFFHVKITF